ncbi:MAG: hypothetical protein V4726_10605 [Verrucomicrobiota bacterium]
MNPVKIGTTTREVSDVIAFEFHMPGLGVDGLETKFPSLRADFADGSAAITKGNEAVTLKVLLASLGVREINASSTKETFSRTPDS